MAVSKLNLQQAQLAEMSVRLHPYPITTGQEKTFFAAKAMLLLYELCYNGFMVWNKVSNLQAPVSLRHPVSRKYLPSEKSRDFSDPSTMSSVAVVQKHPQSVSLFNP
jgi:hypothetical protein